MNYKHIRLLALLTTLSLNAMAMERQKEDDSNAYLFPSLLTEEDVLTEIQCHSKLLQEELESINQRLQKPLKARAQATLGMLACTHRSILNLLRFEKAIKGSTRIFDISTTLELYREIANNASAKPESETINGTLRSLGMQADTLRNLIEESVRKAGVNLRIVEKYL